jgi:hypothetical protein
VPRAWLLRSSTWILLIVHTVRQSSVRGSPRLDTHKSIRIPQVARRILVSWKFLPTLLVMSWFQEPSWQEPIAAVAKYRRVSVKCGVTGSFVISRSRPSFVDISRLRDLNIGLQRFGPTPASSPTLSRATQNFFGTQLWLNNPNTVNTHCSC